ncbi:hypothetical protein [Archangium primigenium]|jgi:hypothetical protein|uniref:hypothetical protein n=1 Tax=Melittangium TaxID=44 RepID=UPI00195B75B9|nr:hypothetical protein [Archangium primigenium]MBM7111936.1 hypothetical protein [Archangium primigenium]
MAGILGIEGLSPVQVQEELDRGGRFVVFEYCVSFFLTTKRRWSDVYFVRAGQGTLGLSLGYTMLSLFFGWWGVPWGIIYTPRCVRTNLTGGKDVTEQVLPALLAPRYDPVLDC